MLSLPPSGVSALPTAEKLLHPPANEPPRLMVLIDVEEEFDWQAPFDRKHTATTAVAELGRAVDLLAERGVQPIGVVSYPVAVEPRAAQRLRDFVRAGTLSVGTHLHPWVCPPFEEDVNPRNSFPGNLEPGLEGRKLATLSDAIEAAVGVRPRVYQAGRYGVGPATYALLVEQGYLVDMSTSPAFDYRGFGGPDFTRAGNTPRWLLGSLLGLPVTGGFIGRLAAAGPWLHPAAQALARLRAPALLARSGLLERQRLSPEGHNLSDMQRLTRGLLARGVRAFTLSFHSPSLAPGHTSYARSPAERDELLQHLDDYVRWFLDELHGEPTTPLAMHADALRRSPPGHRP